MKSRTVMLLATIVVIALVPVLAHAAQKTMILSAVSIGPVATVFEYDHVGPYRYGTARTPAGVGMFSASLPLVPGTVVKELQMEACDLSSTGRVEARVSLCSTNLALGAPCDSIAVLSTGDASVPGCQLFAVDLLHPHRVLKNAPYQVDVATVGTTSDTSFKSVRVVYQTP